MTTRTPLVLVADADTNVTELARRELKRHGIRVVAAASGERALRVAEQQRPDLVLLSTTLPGVPGLEVLRRLRAQGPLPAILIAASSGVGRPTRNLSHGDVLTRPFTGADLTARVVEALGKAPSSLASRVTVGGLDIDLEHRTAARDGHEIALTRTEWALLTYLGHSLGQTLTSGDILSEVWGPEYRDDLQFLRVWISRLRSKLAAGTTMSTIRTVHGVGYAFDPEVAQQHVTMRVAVTR